MASEPGEAGSGDAGARDPAGEESGGILLEAWIETRRETDRTLITLASGGIALLVTLQTTLGVHSVLQLGLYAAGLLAFLVVVLSGLWILRRDAVLLAALIREGSQPADRMLWWLDRVVVSSFVLGVVISGLLGITTGAASLAEESGSMNKPKSGSSEITPDREKKSMDGLQDLIPSRPAKGTKEDTPAKSGTKPKTGGGSPRKKN